MSSPKELADILQECKKTNNYDKFIERKKEFIDSEIIFGWPHSWDVQNYLDKSDIEYFYERIKHDVKKVGKNMEILIKYMVLPVELMEMYYNDVGTYRNNYKDEVYEYFQKMRKDNINNVKYFVSYLQKNSPLNQNNIVNNILYLKDKDIIDETLKKIQNMNDKIDTEYLVKIATHFNNKSYYNYNIKLKEFLGTKKYLEYIVDNDKVNDISKYTQEEVNYILFYKLNNLETKTEKLVRAIGKVLNIDLDADSD
jgi:hypothetical protein